MSEQLPTYAEIEARGARLGAASAWARDTRRILGDASDIGQPKPFPLSVIAAVTWDHVLKSRQQTWSDSALLKWLD